MRHATGAAFKRIEVGQVLKSRRYSNEPHDLSAAWAKRSLSRDVPQFRSYRVVDGRRSLLSGCHQINVWQSKVRKTRRGGSRRISPSARAIAQVIESDAQKEATSATVSRLKL